MFNISSLQLFLDDPLWDAPFYKKLAMNDTGAAKGHQGGMVIPKELREYFPGLTGKTSASIPTLDRRISVALYVDDEYLETVDTRYQIQTWGGTRSPESRLTDNLSALRNRATGGDLLIIQRSIDDLDKYRLLLLSQKSRIFLDVLNTKASKNWGLLSNEVPLTNGNLEIAEIEEKTVEESPFQLFDHRIKIVESKSLKIARSIVFRKTVLEAYKSLCCVCGESLRSPFGAVSVQAAHIVPKSIKGTDDARNGLSLCIRHHWAFDNWLFGVDETRSIFVSNRAKEYASNQPLINLHGKKIIEAADANLRAADEALAWHLANRVA